ncbi:MAG: DUF4358 domain-containing protein [bacterium]|nr:DUF4358 domain-containing protein [bacterium]
MKKNSKGCIIAVLAMGMMAVSMIGCNSKQTENPSASENEITAQTNAPKLAAIDVDKLADKIAKCGGFKDELSVLDTELFEAQYSQVDMDTVVKECAYVGTGATTEQIVVVEAKDTESAQKVKAALQSKIDDDIKANQDYKPEEVAKLKAPVLEVKEQYVIMVIANDKDKVEAVIESECK